MRKFALLFLLTVLGSVIANSEGCLEEPNFTVNVWRDLHRRKNHDSPRHGITHHDDKFKDYFGNIK